MFLISFTPVVLGSMFWLSTRTDNDLKELENKHINTPLIVTGSGLGGYLAILSTLRLHHAIDMEESSNGSKKTKRPICITFGSPLVGDASLQCAIAEWPQWKSSFLNVVAKKDPVASFYSSSTPYKPFGTSLFCTESGGHSAFEDQDSILSIRRKVLYCGDSELGEFNLNSLRAGITLQLKEVGVLDVISNDQIGEMEEKQKVLTRSKKKAYEPTKKLNEMKISLTYMEWHMKKNKLKGGYYDSYKNPKTQDEIKSQQEILKRQRFLNQYWKDTVEEKERMPQKEGAKLRKRWLYGGTNYRRIVEPLDIAEHYKNGNTNDMKYRSDNYKLLEK
ncbi:hypothetical protein L1987_65845 [Smallanthus sonchifolius]|uniref:Uncharacterized protein n=1 Tax=Smallanthus sonchifolius TaxID=185202 RepID=A0ACB9BVQ2_9ASTR|nr:hypothetical protein L1987_65845 [Smallanthus sonchifolius]